MSGNVLQVASALSGRESRTVAFVMANLARGTLSRHWRLLMESHLTDISRVIQLAVAPVFLLTAIATLISAMNARLGRIVDRRRVVQARCVASGGSDVRPVDHEAALELEQLARRSRLVYYAIFGAVLAALLVCLVVAGAFLGALLSVDIARIVAGLFIAAMLAMIAGLGLFLREIYLAVRIGSHIRH